MSQARGIISKVLSRPELADNLLNPDSEAASLRREVGIYTGQKDIATDLEELASSTIEITDENKALILAAENYVIPDKCRLFYVRTTNVTASDALAVTLPTGVENVGRVIHIVATLLGGAADTISVLGADSGDIENLDGGVYQFICVLVNGQSAWGQLVAPTMLSIIDTLDDTPANRVIATIVSMLARANLISAGSEITLT